MIHVEREIEDSKSELTELLFGFEELDQTSINLRQKLGLLVRDQCFLFNRINFNLERHGFQRLPVTDFHVSLSLHQFKTERGDMAKNMTEHLMYSIEAGDSGLFYNSEVSDDDKLTVFFRNKPDYPKNPENSGYQSIMLQLKEPWGKEQCKITTSGLDSNLKTQFDRLMPEEKITVMWLLMESANLSVIKQHQLILIE